MKKKIDLVYCLFLCILFSTSNLSQAPDTLWTRTFGGSNIDVGNCVQQTADSGYIITGYTNSFGTMSGRNVWLIKTDKYGNEQWNKTFGGNNDEEGNSVQQTSDGGYIITGYTNSFGAGEKDVLLIKTDPTGKQSWLKTFGDTQDDEGYSVLQANDGEYIIAGVASSSTSGSTDGWIIKADSSGNLRFEKKHGGLDSDGLIGSKTISAGGYILTGWTYSYGTALLSNAWLVRVDSLGDLRWHQYFGGSDDDRGNSVQQTNDGGYIIAGYTASYGAGLYDMLLIKSNGSGVEEWTKTFGGTGRDYGNSVQQTSDGGFIILGNTFSVGAGSDDFYLVKTDSTGNVLWSTTYGGSASDVGYYVRETNDGGLILTGHTLSYGAGVHDVWLLKIAPEITNVERYDDLNPSDFFVYQNYPNPFNPTTKIKFSVPLVETHRDASLQVKLTVFDILGNNISTLVDEQKSAGTYEVEFDATGLTSGIYFYQLKADSFIETKKMILIR